MDNTPSVQFVRTPQLSELQMRPLHATFEDVGVPGAIRRLWTQLRAEGQLAPLISQSGAAHPPAWLTGDFSTATLACNPDVTPCAREQAMELVDTLRRTCLQINAERGNAGIANGSAHRRRRLPRRFPKPRLRCPGNGCGPCSHLFGNCLNVRRAASRTDL